MNLLSTDDTFEEQNFASGDVLVFEGKATDFVYLIRRGKVATFTMSSDRIYPISLIDGDGLVGEDCTFTGAPSNYSAVVLENTTAVKIPVETVQNFIKESPAWVGNLFGEISGRLMKTIDIIGEHKILDDKLFGGVSLTEQEEKMLRKSIT